MEEGYVGINLLVNGISYPLVVRREEEPYYRQAARLINEKLLKYKDIFATESSEKPPKQLPMNLRRPMSLARLMRNSTVKIRPVLPSKIRAILMPISVCNCLSTGRTVRAT